MFFGVQSYRTSGGLTGCLGYVEKLHEPFKKKNLVVFGYMLGIENMFWIICFGWLGSGNSNICYFHLETCGHDPIWRGHIFSNGLVKNHQPDGCSRMTKRGYPFLPICLSNVSVSGHGWNQVFGNRVQALQLTPIQLPRRNFNHFLPCSGVNKWASWKKGPLVGFIGCIGDELYTPIIWGFFISQL